MPDTAAGLPAGLAQLPDPRARRGVRHRLPVVVSAAVCAVVASSRSYTAIAEWVDDVPATTALTLGIDPDRRPYETMIRRLLQALKSGPRWSRCCSGLRHNGAGDVVAEVFGCSQATITRYHDVLQPILRWVIRPEVDAQHDRAHAGGVLVDGSSPRSANATATKGCSPARSTCPGRTYRSSPTCTGASPIWVTRYLGPVTTPPRSHLRDRHTPGRPRRARWPGNDR